MPDPEAILAATERSFGRRQIQAGHALMVVIGRDFQHPIGEVWEALSNPEHLAAYFARPTGDLRLGGEYTLPDGSHGSILRCDPPRLLTVSWVRERHPMAELEFRLSAEEKHTRLELRYASVRKRFAVTAEGSGEWGAGAGWEFFLDDLESYLQGNVPEEAPGVVDRNILEGERLELFEVRNHRWLAIAVEFQRDHTL